MAPVLQCPDCGEKHPLASVPAQGAFPCRACGRALKVPDMSTRPAAAPPAAAPSVAAPPAVAPAVAAPPVVRPVPVATAVAGPTPADEAASPADPTAARPVPAVDGKALGAVGPRSGRRAAARLGHVPWWMRFLVWIVAVPLSFILVFVIARAFSVFTSNQLSDLFLANDTSRFWPVARLLPFVALLTALLVQGGVFVLARLRGRGDAARSSRDLTGSARRPLRR
jgi:hypothetical protein